ncbi:MAG: nucleoside kinase [Desulfosporosinus sp.]|jgi:uridine kinase
MDKINVTIQGGQCNGQCRQYDKGITLLEISRDFTTHFKTAIIACTVNNNSKEMSTTRLYNDCTIEFFDLTSDFGIMVYQQSLVFVMLMAAKDLFPQGYVTVENTLSKGLYCDFHLDYPLTPHDVEALETRMNEIIAEDLPIRRRNVPIAEAVKLFEAIGEKAKATLINQANFEKVALYLCGEYYNNLYIVLVPSTGYLKIFELKHHAPGLILRFPLKDAPDKLPEYIEMPKLEKVFIEAKRWGKIVECDYIATLNEYVKRGEINNVILISEALHEKKIAEIADHIISNLNRLKMILVAGPSSSGKTTFIQRLSIQLKVLGINTIRISVDDYFLDREKLPANPDLESLDVVDVDLFNNHINSLLKGEEIELPRFDFRSGRQFASGQKAQIHKKEILVIEGIHGLNGRLTASVPRHHKLKILISPLTQIALDEHTHMRSTDARLIRRIVRDSQFRSNDALSTLRGWDSVKRGEERNIFPLSEEVDIMFNTALIYEMAVLRTFATPLLETVTPEYPEHREARRLTRLLSYFFPVTDAEIPLNSILREFIGKSCFFS